MTDVKDEDRLIDSREENPIGSTVAASLKQLADWFVKRRVFGSEWCAFGLLCQRLDLLTCAGEPDSGRLRSATLADVMIGGS